MKLRVAFAGGGTGGHIYPALGIDEAIRAEFAADAYEARFFGNAGGLERDLVPKHIPLTFIPSAPLQRKFSFGTLRTLAMNAVGVLVALVQLARFKPLMVIATGGYVCFPVVVAARILRTLRILRCGIALLEINATPGLTNRLLAPLVDEVWITYAASATLFGKKAWLTGTPTRASLRRRHVAADARARLGLSPTKTTIVAMGGSQGARSINEAIAALVTRRSLQPNWQVLHVSGSRDYAYMQAEERELAEGNTVRLVEYLPDPTDAYAAADVVIARAGASTLGELAVTGTPALLIPYPFAADAHQQKNAELFAAVGAATIIGDDELDGDRLWWALLDVLAPDVQRTMRAAMRSLAPVDAGAAIVIRIQSLIPARVIEGASTNEASRG